MGWHVHLQVRCNIMLVMCFSTIGERAGLTEILIVNARRLYIIVINQFTMNYINFFPLIHFHVGILGTTSDL